MCFIRAGCRSLQTDLCANYKEMRQNSWNKATIGKLGFLMGALFSCFQGIAQCPASIALTIRNNTAANCPSSGSITIGSNAGVGSLQYTVTAGPSGAPVNLPQSDSAFNALPAGSYTLKVVCATNPAVSNTISFTIANGYTAMSNIATTITSNCGSGSAGGTINVTGVTGGKAPLQYSVIKNTDPNYPDNLSVYSTGTSFAPNAYGVYQVRVKDACGQIYTKTVELLAGLPPVKLGGNFLDNQPCGSNKYEFDYWLVDPVSGVSVSAAPYWNAGGLTIKIYEALSGCTKGNLLASYTNETTGRIISDKSPSEKYYIEVTTPCGNTTTACTYRTDGRNEAYIKFATAAGGCGTGPSPATMSIYVSDYNFLHFPVSVSIVNKTTGLPVMGSPFSITSASSTVYLGGLLPADYIVTAIDGCGRQVEKDTLQNVVNAGAPSISLYQPGDFDCANNQLTTQEGTVRVGIQLNGYIPGISNAPNVKITAGPSNVGIVGVNAPGGSTIYYWQNMLPGNYTVLVTTSCGTTALNFTLTAPYGTLIQHIKAKSTSFCGGNGRVEIDTAQTRYNGYGDLIYVLVNTITGKSIDSTTAGVFTNLPAGTYKINMKIHDYCTNTYYNVSSNAVTINAAGASAGVVKKVGVICEDVSGNLLTTGSAYLELAGASPLVVEYKKATDAAWINFSSDAPANITINGLAPGEIYDIRITSCGKSSATQVSIGKLNAIKVSNLVNPCVNSPYDLAVPEMAGATYVWKNPAGVVVSNTYNYAIPNYNVSYNGIYTCTVSFGSCVTRIVSAGLSSVACGQALPVTILSFGVERTGDNVKLNWKTSAEKNSAYFEVQRSIDGVAYTAVGVVNASFNTQGIVAYDYTDAAIPAGTLYYRLKMVDNDASFQYSTVRILRNGMSATIGEGKVTIMPNPATNGQNITMLYDGPKVSGVYSIMSTAGQVVQRGNIEAIGEGANTVIFSLNNLNPGMYLMVFTAADGTVVYRGKISIQ